MDHANTDPRLADVDVAKLLIDQLLRDGLLRVAIELGRRDMDPRTHGAGRLWIGRIDADRFLGDRRRPHRKAQSGTKPPKNAFHDDLPFPGRHAAWRSAP